MLSRRQFLTRSLQGSSLLTLSSVVPQFIARTARAAEAGKDNILVVVEMTGGNDGLNTVIPYADDLYHKFRPTLRQTKNQVVKLNDHIGLNSGMRSFDRLLQHGELAVVQGVGYPNPERSHFESMDIWQSADPSGKTTTGWLGRGANELRAPAAACRSCTSAPAVCRWPSRARPAAPSASTTTCRTASSSAAATRIARRRGASCSKTWRSRPRTTAAWPTSSSAGRCRR